MLFMGCLVLSFVGCFSWGVSRGVSWGVSWGGFARCFGERRGSRAAAAAMWRAGSGTRCGNKKAGDETSSGAIGNALPE